LGPREDAAMKAFVVERYGNNDGVRLVDMPEPVPGPG
jgi:NADPH:quinone reductase-like Zn-dependent oxidoreductase